MYIEMNISVRGYGSRLSPRRLSRSLMFSAAAILAPAMILAAILPLASIHDAQGVDVNRATELTRRARELVVRGEAFQAIALLQSELHPANDPQAQAYLLFTRGWLEQKVAEDADADRAIQTQ